MFELFEIFIADCKVSPLLMSLCLAVFLVLIATASRMLHSIFAGTRIQSILVFFGFSLMLTCYLGLGTYLRQGELDKFSPQSFNEALPTTLPNFKGVGDCRKEGLHLKGTFKTTVSVKEGEFPAHVPVDMLVSETDICNYGFILKPAYINQQLQYVAADYLNKNAESVRQDISKIFKTKPAEVVEVKLDTGLKVEVAKSLLTPSVAVEPQESTPNSRVERKVNVNTRISGQ